MRRSDFQPTLTELETRDVPAAYWATHWWTREHHLFARPAVAKPAAPAPTVPPPAPRPVAAVRPPAPPAPPAPAPAPAPAAPTTGDRVLAFARANVGREVTRPDATGCAALATAALAAAGAVPQARLGTAGPVANHLVWGSLVYRRAVVAGYSPTGVLGGIRPGDIIQVEQYRERRPNGSSLFAWHHTAVVESVDAATGRVGVIHQNWNGNPAATRGAFFPATMTSGVISVYRPTA